MILAKTNRSVSSRVDIEKEVKNLEKKIKEASDELDFETAIIYRDENAKIKTDIIRILIEVNMDKVYTVSEINKLIKKMQ